MSIKFYSYGAAEEVTGSKHVIEYDGKRIMIDCGSFQGHRQEADRKNRNLPFDPKTIYACIMTHAHFDHCGSYPTIIKNGFIGSIYTTPATRDLASLIMMDSANIQSKDIEYLKKKAGKKGESFDLEPIYDESDVLKVLNQIICIPQNREFYIDEKIKAVFYEAGHILGSSQVYLEIKEGDRIVRIGFTGDLGRKNLPILKDPASLPKIDYLICESTYGNKLHDDMSLTLKKLSEIINETVKSGGKIIIPAFAVERTQELVYYIHLLVKNNQIPRINIYIDSPMSTNATSIFKIHPECFDEEINKEFLNNHENPFTFDNLIYTNSVEDSKKINELKDPAIIISSSGMCEAGRILHHLAHNVEDPKNTILIVGFMAENTLGRRIAEKQKEIKIFNDMYKLNARVELFNAFSAHADYNEISDYIDSLDYKNIKKVFLVHGEKEAQISLKSILGKKVNDVQIVKYDEEYVL
jgi:metallo-beta-lactamase family protein